MLDFLSITSSALHPMRFLPSLFGGGEHCNFVQEAANLSWELRGRDATVSYLEGGMLGLRALLRAADGRDGNAGVVDLMLRYVVGALSHS